MIQRDEFKSIIEADEDILVINVSDQDSYEAGHIPGSLCIPLDRTDFADEVQRQSTGRNQRVVLYGEMVLQARDRLLAAGYATVDVLAGGLQEWRRAGLPVVSGIVAL